MAISKSRHGSCFSSRNTNRLSPLDLHLVHLLFLAFLASCSALAIETTEVPEVNEATTIIPAQIEESLPIQTQTNQNDTTPSAHPLESPKADATDPAAFAQSSGTEVQDSFVSVYGGTLEQDIKNDVNSEVEEAPSPAETLKETVSQVAEVAVVETENQETEAAVQNAREPKTLETQEAEGKPAEPETVTDTIAVASEQVESRSQDDPDSLSLNENQAITEEPITKTNLLALEQEHKVVEVAESTGTPVPIYEEAKHQVTKKQGVEDLLPIEVAPEVVDEPEIVREERQFEEHNPNLNEIEDEKATVNTFLKSAGELQGEIEKETEEEAKEELEKEVAGTAPSQETVVEAADAEDSQPGVEEDAVLGATEKGVTEEKEDEPMEEEHKEEETKDKELKEEEPKEEELTEEKPKEEEPKEEDPKAEETKEEELKDELVQEEEPNDKGIDKEENPKVEEPKEEELKEEKTKEDKPNEEAPKEETPKEEELKEKEPKEEEPKKVEPQEEVYHHINSEEPIIPASPSSTQKPVEVNVPLRTDNESVEDKELDHESVEEKEKDAQSSEPKEDNDDSSEETHEPAADEAKASSADDSTATPLVSYPPHDAGQTFDSNSADEHSAQLSGPSNYRSTLIIALCSGTAVIFIVASLVIFVVSFQRQHGTLDIEMQEQRLGKDDRDEEDAQVKLLEVDLSTPVIVSLGNEETDECL